MSEKGIASPIALSNKELDLIARRLGGFSGLAFVDVGCGAGQWVRQQHARGRRISGMEDRAVPDASAAGIIASGSPAAAIPWPAHSLDVILFRGTSAFTAAAFSPERMIAFANLASSLKANGRLIIPLKQDIAEGAYWQQQLQIFPGDFRIRTLTSGLRGLLTFQFLFGGMARIDVAEFRVKRKTTSRLEWHRLAREAVLSRATPPAAA